jgi:hypothetical protein
VGSSAEKKTRGKKWHASLYFDVGQAITLFGAMQYNTYFRWRELKM